MKRFLVLFLIVACAGTVFAQSSSEVKKAEKDSLRIVSLAPNVTEIIYSLGAQDSLVGRTDYCNFPLEVLDLPSIGNLWEPNLEAILALDANVVIASSIVSQDFIESLNKAGIQAYQFYEEESLEGTYALIEKIASVLGKQEVGKAIVSDMKARVQAVSDKVSSIAERKSVVYMIGYGDWGDYAATGETYLDDVIEAAGGINAAKNGNYWSISRELLLSQDPDVIIHSAYSYSDPDAIIADFCSLAPYSELSASKTGNVYTIDGDAAERQGVRTVDTIEEIARILYPELF